MYVLDQSHRKCIQGIFFFFLGLHLLYMEIPILEV